ncbi:lipocalin [Methyloprofundus sedimenti]|uniref:Outer membrane lipoprotein Blc n=1 Tax=Methyloprofundus sedimenti TaxID=1420851 RepID=A0A1V8M3Q2_9GAMM|nr:lipocalin family protein [Methyloprofundus sedimenti]OQK16023.1 lipocalin [Methyloprofundus sedimenti]
MKAIFFSLFFILTACTGIPEGIKPVEQFDVSRYLGKWYEIARLDHRFERGLTAINAEYSLREDGGLKVLNSGYNIKTGERDQAEGKAYFLGKPDIGSLKVSFFGPFYGGYHIIALDKLDYQYAMITGPDLDYLWILARTPTLDQAILQRLIARAKGLGFAVDKLIFTEQPQTSTRE